MSNINWIFILFLGQPSGRTCCVLFFSCQSSMTDQKLQNLFTKNLETKNKSSLKTLTAKFTSRGTSTSAATWTTMLFWKIITTTTMSISKTTTTMLISKIITLADSKTAKNESRGNVNFPTKKSTRTLFVICWNPTRSKNLRFNLLWKKILNVRSALSLCVCREESLLVIVDISSAQSVWLVQK